MNYFIKLNLIEELDKDSIMRTELALALNISERAVYNTVRRYMIKAFPNSSFTKIAAIKYFQSKGYSEEDIIFVPEQPVK